MAYHDVGPYILSDDLDVFLDLLYTSPPVLYFDPTRSKDGQIMLRPGTPKSIGVQKWLVKKKFVEKGWLFLDPATQYDPELFSLRAIVPDALAWLEGMSGMAELIGASRYKLQRMTLMFNRRS